MARSTQVNARERAREAVRRREAERAQREKQVQQELTSFFEGDELVSQGHSKMSAAVVRLVDELGESAADVAELLGLEVREVNRLKREASTNSDGAGDSDDNDVASQGGRDQSDAESGGVVQASA